MSGVFRHVVHTAGKSDEGTRLTFGPCCGLNWPISTGSGPLHSSRGVLLLLLLPLQRLTDDRIHPELASTCV